MPRKQFEHIQRIRKKYHASETVKDILNNTHQILASELYNRNPHFLFELIQNAEDNTYSEAIPYLSFQLTRTDPTSSRGSEGALIIENNETGFTPDDVDVICNTCKSTKKKAQGYIGEKGIGFKSVFLVTTSPHIFSNGYHFCLPERDRETGFGYVMPHWVAEPPKGLHCSQTHIILPLTRPDFGYNRIEEMLLEIEPETILFLSKLREIRIKTDSGTDFSITKNNDAMPEVELLVEGEKQHQSYSKTDIFLICTETVNKPTDIRHEKREGIKDREVSLAFPLDEDSESVGKIFAYLPVRSDTGFPFLINADFILPSSREDIQDVPWNHWLMDCVADLVASMLLPALKERRLLTADFLEKLASRLNDIGLIEIGTSYAVNRDSLFCPIFVKAREAFMNEELLPANDGKFVSARNAKFADSEGLRNLLDPSQLSLLFERPNVTKWVISDITARRTHDLWRFLRNEFRIEEVDPKMFARRLSEPFLQQQSDEWFIKFYKFLSVDERAPKSLWHPPYSILRFKPIIRLQDGKHVNPSPGKNSPPNAYLPIGSDTDTSFPIIKVELTQDEEVRRFLSELGVPEWDIVEEVIKHILPKYDCNLPMVTVEDHQTDFEKIERAFGKALGDKRYRLEKRLQETAFILAKNTRQGTSMYRKPDKLYFESDELRIYFEGNNSRGFVNLDEYPPSALGLLKDLGIKNAVKVIKQEPDDEGYVVVFNSRGSHKRGLNGFDLYIEVDGLEHAVTNPAPDKSAFIWSKIARRNADCIRGTTETATKQNYEKKETKLETSTFGELLINSKWLPNSDGLMHRPCELTLDDLPPSFKRDAKLAEQLGMKRDEESELAEKVGISVEWIEVLKGAKPEVLKNPGMLEKFKELLGGEDSVEGDATILGSSNPEFPERPVKDPERRAVKFGEELENSPTIVIEERARSVRVNPPKEAARVRLKSEYTNDDGQMICQICKETMPFKKPDGEYYFEAIEAITKEHHDTEHEAKFLALCPVCAARYQVFIKQDEDAMQAMIDGLMKSKDCQVQLQLGELNATLRFVGTHWRDIKQILESA